MSTNYRNKIIDYVLALKESGRLKYRGPDRFSEYIALNRDKYVGMNASKMFFSDLKKHASDMAFFLKRECKREDLLQFEVFRTFSKMEKHQNKDLWLWGEDDTTSEDSSTDTEDSSTDSEEEEEEAIGPMD